MIENHQCLQCGIIFKWERLHAGRPKQYCSIKCRDKARYNRRKKDPVFRKRMAQHQRKYNIRNKDKLKCRSKGKTYPMEPYCEMCGSTEKLERHHKSYSKPDVFMTLCKTCHENTHH